MKTLCNVSFIGSGQVATQLALGMENLGHSVKYVYGRNFDHSNDLVRKLYSAQVKTDLDFSEKDIDLVIICVNDDSIESVASEIIVDEETIVVHTSGTQPLSLLDYTPTDKTGVFYPLQTFSKERKTNWQGLPLCVEGSDTEVETILYNIAHELTGNAHRLTTYDRKIIHLSAVFACNFTNHLYTISKEILEDHGLEFDLLKPLILETVQKAMHIGPENAQTGPAMRSDQEVISTHLSQLSDKTQLRTLYQLITDLITEKHS